MVQNPEIRNLIAWAASKAPYFGIVGAAIALISWMITNTISSRLDRTKTTIDRARADYDLNQRLSLIRRGYREVKATLSRLDIMLSEMNSKSIFSALPRDDNDALKNSYALIQTAETSFFQHEDLGEMVSVARKLCGAVGVPRRLTNQLNSAIEESEESLKTYDSAVRVWDDKKKKSIELIKDGGQPDKSLLQQGVSDFQQATSAYIKTAVPLHERFVEQRERLARLHGQILQHLASKLERLKTAHRVSEKTSWVLYALGTSLIILGKWLELK